MNKKSMVSKKNSKQFGFYCRPSIAETQLRFFVFHHAGGSHLTYKNFVKHFPENWDIILIDYPGRGLYSHLQPLESMPLLLQWILQQFDDSVYSKPFAFFGHSMGASVICSLIDLQLERGLPTPFWSGISGCCSPTHQPLLQQHKLDNDQLKQHLIQLGGVPRTFYSYPELWDIYLPIIRADLNVIEGWHNDNTLKLLTSSLSTFCGSQDPLVNAKQMEDWRCHTTGVYQHHELQGDHFYFINQEVELSTQIISDVNNALLL